MRGRRGEDLQSYSEPGVEGVGGAGHLGSGGALRGRRCRGTAAALLRALLRALPLRLAALPCFVHLRSGETKVAAP